MAQDADGELTAARAEVAALMEFYTGLLDGTRHWAEWDDRYSVVDRTARALGECEEGLANARLVLHSLMCENARPGLTGPRPVSRIGEYRWREARHVDDEEPELRHDGDRTPPVLRRSTTLLAATRNATENSIIAQLKRAARNNWQM